MYFCFQLTPFPFDLIQTELEKYPGAQVSWVQEEHKNSGAWPYVQPRFNTVIKKEGSQRFVKYVIHTHVHNVESVKQLSKLAKLVKL